MKTSSLALLLLPALAACRVCHSSPQPAHSPSSATIPSATAASIPTLDAPVPTSTSVLQENIDLRAREVVVNPNAAQPTAAAGTVLHGVEQVSVTVQWVETMLHGSIHTWVPVTVAVTFVAVPSQAPQPGKGVVGMGTLTGETGVTKTVMAGAAPTIGAGWMGLGAAVGLGLAGLVV